MNRLLNFPLLLLVFSFSSCIEFEREKLTYVHDEEKDELRVTLRYEGIYGNFLFNFLSIKLRVRFEYLVISGMRACNWRPSTAFAFAIT